MQKSHIKSKSLSEERRQNNNALITTVIRHLTPGLTYGFLPSLTVTLHSYSLSLLSLSFLSSPSPSPWPPWSAWKFLRSLSSYTIASRDEPPFQTSGTATSTFGSNQEASASLTSSYSIQSGISLPSAPKEFAYQCSQICSLVIRIRLLPFLFLFLYCSLVSASQPVTPSIHLFLRARSLHEGQGPLSAL